MVAVNVGFELFNMLSTDDYSVFSTEKDIEFSLPRDSGNNLDVDVEVERM